VPEEEQKQGHKIESTARAACDGEGPGAGEGGDSGKDGRRLRATVVNLAIDTDSRSSQTTSKVYNGIRKVMLKPRPQSDKGRSRQGLELQGQPERQSTTLEVALLLPGSVSNASHNATIGASHSHIRPRIPSAPLQASSEDAANSGADASAENSGVASSGGGGKLLLKKFNKLEVFGERRYEVFVPNTTAEASPSDDTAVNNNVNSKVNSKVNGVVLVNPHDKKGPYLPQTRPPTYKMDVKYNHPLYGRNGRGGSAGAAEGNSRGNPGMVLGDRNSTAASFLPIRSPPDHRSEAMSLSFRFHNGEVIVSRQGKRPTAPDTAASVEATPAGLDTDCEGGAHAANPSSPPPADVTVT
jgi:hypothetical protein